MNLLWGVLAHLLRWLILLGAFLFFAKFCFDPGRAPWTRDGRPTEEGRDKEFPGGIAPETHDDTEA